MASYTVTILGLSEQSRDPEVVRAAVDASIADDCGNADLGLDPEFGRVYTVVVNGDVATVTVTGATEEYAAAVDGRVYQGLYT